MQAIVDALSLKNSDADKDDRKAVRMIYYFLGQIVIEHTAREQPLPCKAQVLKFLMKNELNHEYIPRFAFSFWLLPHFLISHKKQAHDGAPHVHSVG